MHWQSAARPSLFWGQEQRRYWDCSILRAFWYNNLIPNSSRVWKLSNIIWKPVVTHLAIYHLSKHRSERKRFEDVTSRGWEPQKFVFGPHLKLIYLNDTGGHLDSATIIKRFWQKLDFWPPKIRLWKNQRRFINNSSLAKHQENNQYQGLKEKQGTKIYYEEYLYLEWNLCDTT